MHAHTFTKRTHIHQNLPHRAFPAKQARSLISPPFPKFITLYLLYIHARIHIDTHNFDTQSPNSHNHATQPIPQPCTHTYGYTQYCHTEPQLLTKACPPHARTPLPAKCVCACGGVEDLQLAACRICPSLMPRPTQLLWRCVCVCVCVWA